MNDAISTPSQRPHTALVWIGRLIAAALAFMFGMSGVMKLKGGPELAEGMAHLGLPDSMVCPLAILELTCPAPYLLPRTWRTGLAQPVSPRQTVVEADSLSHTEIRVALKWLRQDLAAWLITAESGKIFEGFLEGPVSRVAV